MSTNIHWQGYTKEATKLLSELLQIDTTNPPGNEQKAAKYLQGLLEKEGIKSEILESEKKRSNLIARLKGRKAGPKLLLLSHTDVVPVTDPKRWKYPPFSGAVKEGYIWGRGALDMKCMTAMETLVMLLFARLDLKFSGELIYVAVADEEKGGTYGARWLLKKHKAKVKADYIINEGGGMPLSINGKTFYTIDNVEKGLWWVRLRIKGVSGHGSVPHDNNALAKAARLIDKIANYRFPKMIAPSVREFFTKVAEALGPMGQEAASLVLAPDQEADLKQLLSGTPVDPHLVNAFIRTTVSPTMIQAGVKENVIPDSCEFVLDFRLVPGYSREKIEETIYELAGELKDDLEIETIQYNGASESPIDTELYKLIEETVREELPGVDTVPLMLTGATDSRFWREIGTIAYGFCPLSTKMSLAERAKLIHSDNERIDIESMELGTRLLAKIAMKVLKAET